MTKIVVDKSSESYFVGTSNPALLVELDSNGNITDTVDLSGFRVNSMNAHPSQEEGEPDAAAIEMICIIVRNDSASSSTFSIYLYKPSSKELMLLLTTPSGQIPFVFSEVESAKPIFSPDGSVVYITFNINSRLGFSRAFSTDTGEVLWEEPSVEEASADTLYNGFGISPDGTSLDAGVMTIVCNDTTNNGLVEIDASTGLIVNKWTAPSACTCPSETTLCNNIWSQPIVDDSNGVYVNVETLGSTKFDGSSIVGGPLWARDEVAEGQPFYSSSFGPNQSRVYSGFESSVWGWSANVEPSGVQAFLVSPYPDNGGFQRSTTKWGPSDAVSGDVFGAVHVRTQRRMLCLSAFDGEFLWSFTVLNDVLIPSGSEVVGVQASGGVGKVVSLNTFPPTEEPSTMPSLAPSSTPSASSAPTDAPSTSSPTLMPSPMPLLVPTAFPTSGSVGNYRQNGLLANTNFFLVGLFLVLGIVF